MSAGRGFTLIEVLVALLVATVLSAAIATSTRAALRGERASTRRETAARLVTDAIETILAAAPESLEPRDDEAVVDAAGESWRVRSLVEAGPAPGLWRISVVARAERDGFASEAATLRRALWVRP